MVVRIEIKALCAMFWHGDKLIAGCKYDWQSNSMDCQILGNGYVIGFGFPCFNDGKDLSDAIGKTKMRLQKEYGNIEFC